MGLCLLVVTINWRLSPEGKSCPVPANAWPRLSKDTTRPGVTIYRVSSALASTGFTVTSPQGPEHLQR